MKLKKHLSIYLVLCMLVVIFSVPVSAAGTQSRYYTDVYTTDSYHDASIYLNEHSIMFGYTSTTFAPSANITRGDLVTILWRMLNRPIPDGTSSSFTDVGTDTYYYNAIRWASSSNVLLAAGYGDGTFLPNRPVTNQELFTFMYRFICYCEYIGKTAAENTYYTSAYENAPLLYRNTFIDYGVIPTGWAYQDGFITDYSIKGTENATRGETAEYIYHMYEKYQEKYGLSVVNTSDMPYVSVCDDAMNTLFTHYGADSNNYENLTKAGFTTAMNNAFQDAKGLDLCYLYCASHGGTSGLALFSGSPTIMTPTFLRNQIDMYNGTFIVFVSGCHSGTYVSSEDGSDDLIYIEDEFDTDSFVEILTGTDDIYTVESDLRDGSRIKVLCSSRKEEVSYSTDKLATNYWCLGSGYNFRNNSYTSMYADSNTDGRISLEELYLYSYEKIQNSVSQQHVVRYPYNDPIIIFENRF